MTPQTVHVLLVAIVGGLLLVVALALFQREARHRALLKNIQRVVSDEGAAVVQASRRPGTVVLGTTKQLGLKLQQTSIFSARDIADLERTARAAGFSPQTAVPFVIGGKCVLMVACPVLAYFAASVQGYDSTWRAIATLSGIALGMFGPNFALGYARRLRLAALRLGLTDALDLLVVCAEAGLALESAIERVAAEMRFSSPAVAGEFNLLGQDLRLTSDRGSALVRMGERTQLESFQRLTVTLAQSLRYGTPLGQALRVLAHEMRNDRLLRLEEKAARLPTLLMIPLGVFILPCLFIVVGGPAVLRIMETFSH